MNIEHNPVLCDITDSLFIEKKSSDGPLSILPYSFTEKSSESIQLYLYFLSNVTSLFIQVRQTVEQYQSEPFDLIKSIHNHCQQYHEGRMTEPIEEVKTVSQPSPSMTIHIYIYMY